MRKAYSTVHYLQWFECCLPIVFVNIIIFIIYCIHLTVLRDALCHFILNICKGKTFSVTFSLYHRDKHIVSCYYLHTHNFKKLVSLSLSWCQQFVSLCVGRDLDGTAQSLKGVESEKEELHSLTTLLQQSLEVISNRGTVASVDTHEHNTWWLVG